MSGKPMKFDLVRPCADCPFRSDRPFGLRPGRPKEIAAFLFERDLTFACHGTTRQPVLQHCAGALILHEKLRRPNWRIRFAAFLGLYDPARLHMDAPIVDTVEEFVAINADEAASLTRSRRSKRRGARGRL
jgi:hypothetical protein